MKKLSTQPIKLQPSTISIGYYTSPVNGSSSPHTVAENRMLFEVITAGAVYTPDLQEEKRSGWVFCHKAGEESVSISPVGEHYECLVLHIGLSSNLSREDWPRWFYWGDDAISFSHEMLRAFHHTGVSKEILESYVWSNLRYRLDLFRQSNQYEEVPPRIAVIIKYIKVNYAEDLNIEKIASAMKLSPSHLHAIFKAAMGITPHQYLMQYRMRIARHNLVSTDMPIKEIASDIGYANTENFCRMFKRSFKITAAAYRKKYTIYERY